MASSLISNSLHISFDSVLGMDDAGLVAVFESFVATGLKGFLGCPVVYYEDALTEFFENGLVRDGMILATGYLFYDVASSSGCKLPADSCDWSLKPSAEYDDVTDDVISTNPSADCDDIKADLIFIALAPACASSKLLEWRLLIDSSKVLIIATANRFVNNPTVKKTPVKKAVSKKRPATDAAAEPVVKKKRTTKSKSVSAKETLEILPVAQEAVPLQKIEPTPAAPAEQRPLPKRKSQKRKRRLVLGSDDEIVDSEPVVGSSIVGEAAVEVVDDTAEKEVEPVVESVDEPVSLPAVADVLNEDISTADDVDIIIEQVIAETAQIQTDEGDQDVDTSDVGVKTVEKADEFITEPVEEMETEAFEQSADVAMSLPDILMTIPADCPLPYANMEITPITLGNSISIPGVDEGDWYKASLPKINPEEKGKAPLQFTDPIKGKPPKEIFSLILADIECLV
ncbi:hypothetical protein F511_04526 [Dorcoceras hygrometricum]|uniref:Uncharacterized protein n=1 Tax=Dorcoceras hygrometricum TaxID=472368 RepID=A0A2Z7D3E5_9LAMI|nr:hypothetical protein F511_04526 [Dorcoceras hygrometricum]